jgi:DNA-binding transcriptional regulator YiaG
MGHAPMTGKEVRRIRRKLGATQVQLANRLGVAPNTVYRWEADRVTVTAPMAQLLRLLGKERSVRR